MWRLVAVARKASLDRLTRGPNLPLLQPQVLHCKTPTFVESVFPAHFSPKIHFHQTPLFFCQESSNPVINDDVETSQIESIVFEESSETYDSSDTSNVLDKMPSSTSSSSIFGEMSENVTVDGLDSGEHESNEGNEHHGVDLEKLEKVLSLLQSSIIDGSLELSLDSMDISLSEEFVLRVVETPLVPGEKLIEFFIWVLNIHEPLVTTRVVESLVRAACNEVKKNNAFALWDLLKELGEDGLLTTKILNDLLSLLSKLGEGEAGFEVFNKFGEFGCVPNEDSFYFTIEALCRRSIFHWAGSVCENMVNAGNLPNSQKIGKIISYMCKGQKAKGAHSVYLSAKKMDRYPPRSSVNFLICSLSREDANVHLALEMLEDISKEERKYAIKLFSSVIRGLCRIKDVEKAKVLLFNMIEAGPPPGNDIFNIIINSLSKAGEMGEALKIMKVMESRGLRPDVYTYSVIMSGYTKGGEMEEACKVLAEAKKKHSKLSPVTYHTLIRGYCKLENFDKALELLSEMKQYGVQPNADEYNKLIQSLCLKALDWETAEKLMREMEDNDLHLNGITKGLIRAVKELEEEKLTTEEVGIEA